MLPQVRMVRELRTSSEAGQEGAQAGSNTPTEQLSVVVPRIQQAEASLQHLQEAVCSQAGDAAAARAAAEAASEQLSELHRQLAALQQVTDELATKLPAAGSGAGSSNSTGGFGGWVDGLANLKTCLDRWVRATMHRRGGGGGGGGARPHPTQGHGPCWLH
jgi:chromosome segregation ATPase